MSPALADGFLTSGPPGNSLLKSSWSYIGIIFHILESIFLNQVDDCIIIYKEKILYSQSRFAG